MKRWGLKFLLLAFVSILVVVAVKYWPRVLTPDQCSEVYRRYKDRDGLSVAFVKDYSIGDSITVDVTTITAKDSTSWESLLRGMNVTEESINENKKLVLEGKHTATTILSAKGYPEKRVSIDTTTSVDLVFFVYSEKCVYVFDANSIDQAFAIANHKRLETVEKYINK
ncbi:MAG: hypothetical protein IJK99_01875 [Bacteroidales bacterium]|nr:hypothetical protein [Bacteroidales bacterium]